MIEVRVLKIRVSVALVFAIAAQVASLHPLTTPASAEEKPQLVGPIAEYFNRICIQGRKFDYREYKKGGTKLSEADSAKYYDIQGAANYAFYPANIPGLSSSEAFVGIVIYGDGGENCVVSVETDEQIGLAVFSEVYALVGGKEISSDKAGPYFFANPNYPRLVQIKKYDDFISYHPS